MPLQDKEEKLWELNVYTSLAIECEKVSTLFCICDKGRWMPSRVLSSLPTSFLLELHGSALTP